MDKELLLGRLKETTEGLRQHTEKHGIFIEDPTGHKAVEDLIGAAAGIQTQLVLLPSLKSTHLPSSKKYHEQRCPNCNSPLKITLFVTTDDD